jgi:hypothetical protein
VNYSKNNIEDWDFSRAEMGHPEYDLQADLFLSRNFTDVIAVDALRKEVIGAFMDKGIAEIEDDREQVRMVENGDGYLAGWKSGASRFSSFGRFERRVLESMRRELAKYGRLRWDIPLPPMPGLRENGV